MARQRPDDPRLAERFELYACGVELANGFGELTDAEEQRARFTAEMDEKERVHGTRYPLDEDFLAALAGMPPASAFIALFCSSFSRSSSGFSRVAKSSIPVHSRFGPEVRTIQVDEDLVVHRN